MDLEPSILTLDESILRNLFNFDQFEDLSFHMDGQMVEGLGHSWQDVGSNLDLFNLDLDLHGFNEIENPMERMIQYVPGSIPSPSPINGDQSTESLFEPRLENPDIPLLDIEPLRFQEVPDSSPEPEISQSSCEESESEENLSPPNPTNRKRRTQNRKSPNVSHWLWDLLQNEKHEQIIEFTNRNIGEFRIVDQNGLAALWGERKGRSNPRNTTYRDLA